MALSLPVSLFVEVLEKHPIAADTWRQVATEKSSAKLEQVGAEGRTKTRHMKLSIQPQVSHMAAVKSRSALLGVLVPEAGKTLEVCDMCRIADALIDGAWGIFNVGTCTVWYLSCSTRKQLPAAKNAKSCQPFPNHTGRAMRPCSNTG